MKFFSLLVLLIAISPSSSKTQDQDQSLDRVRLQFYKATLDYQYAFPLIEQLNGIEDPVAIMLAYKGATEAILAKPGWNPFKKLRHLKNSRSLLQQAITSDAGDVEIRFLRLSVEHHIPKYLGFSDHMEQDKTMIMDNLNRFRKKGLPQEITDYILRFSEESGLYTAKEVLQVKRILADQ